MLRIMKKKVRAAPKVFKYLQFTILPSPISHLSFHKRKTEKSIDKMLSETHELLVYVL